jgi:flagellar hook-associated protein 1 FlgK
VRAAALFDNAMAGLQTAQSGMLVTSQNVTGSSVDGYVRRVSNTRINGLSPNSVDISGTSFAVEGFTRFFDRLLQGQVLSQQSKTSYTQTLTAAVAPLDAMLTDPATSLATSLGNFFNAAGSIANEPTNAAYQQSLVGNARQVADRVRGLANAVAQVSDNASQALADVLNQANTITPQLASINAKIRAAAIPGFASASPDLLDERDRLVGKLQDLVGGSTLINEDASASYSLNGQLLVDREVAHVFSNGTGNTTLRSDMRLSDLRLKVTSNDGRNQTLIPLVLGAVQQLDGSGNPKLDAAGNSLMLPGQNVLQDGKAGAYIHLVQNFVPNVQKSINLLAANLVRKVNQVTSGTNLAINSIFGFASTASGGTALTGKSTDTAGKALLDGLFQKPSPQTGDFTYTEIIEGANPQSANFKMSVNASLSQAAFDARQFQAVATFDVSQFTNMDAAASGKLEKLRADFSAPVTFITSSVATTIATWKNDNKANEALQKSLSDQKSAITGVNLDEEAANLVKYQQLYNASSKLMQTGKQMFDTLLGMLS